MDVGSLAELIEKDNIRGGAYDRYPVRFFSMKYEEGVLDTLIQLQGRVEGLEIFDVKDVLVHEDAWITIEGFIKAIEKRNCIRNCMVVGFSEYARFLGQEEFISLLIGLLEIENSARYLKRRIYIPCFALYSQIKRVVKQYHRRMDAYNPLLNETDVEDLPRIFFVENILNIEEQKNEIANSSEWFGMWRNQNIDTKSPIICSSKVLSYFYDKASPDNVYNIQKIKSHQDVLRYMYSVSNLREYKREPEEFYRRIILLIKNMPGKGIKDVILREVNAQSIDAKNIVALWKPSDIFKRWLIQNYILDQSNMDSYLYKIMDTLEELTDKEFLEKVYECIFESREIALCEERKQILSSICKLEKEIVFTKGMISYYNATLISIIRRKTTIAIDEIDLTKDENILAEKSDILEVAIAEEFVPYLTCLSSFERQMIIWLYRMKLISEKHIKVIYPNLWNYIKRSEIESQTDDYADCFEEYFEKYRKIRLAQIESEAYDDCIKKWNGNENDFYEWYLNGKIEYPEIYLRKLGFFGSVYVIDAMGAEFMGYVQALLNEKGYTVKESYYAKCHIPSTTEIARLFYPKHYEWISDYDEKVIHNGIYHHVPNIEKALYEIESIIDRIISIEDDNTFAIIADHGSTVGHKLKKKNKKYEFSEAEHDGRCYRNKEHAYIEPSSDYVVYDDEKGNQWVVALNQQSLYNNSKYAVHGGATLEEILVPVVIAAKGTQATVLYKVKAENLKVSGLQKKVTVKITPMPKNISVKLKAKDGTDIEMIYDNRAKTWMGELKRGMEQDIEIAIGQQVFTFRTIPKIRMGDDLFDE